MLRLVAASRRHAMRLTQQHHHQKNVIHMASSKNAFFRSFSVQLSNSAKSESFTVMKDATGIGKDGNGFQTMIDGTTTAVVDPDFKVILPSDVLQIVESVADPSTASLSLFSPPDLVIRTVTAFHESGLPWWGSIVLLTVLIRTAMLPLTIASQVNATRMALAQPELEKLKERATQDPEVQRKVFEVYSRYGVSMKYMFAPLIVQFPLFISVFFGLRRLTELYPSMKEGGLLWFTDLTAPDPTYSLPLLTAACLLTSIEMGGEVKSAQVNSEVFKNVGRGVAILTVPLTMHFATGLFVYFLTTNVYTVGQIAILKQPKLKQMLGTDLDLVKAQFAKTMPTTVSSSPPENSKVPQASSENSKFSEEINEIRTRRSKRRRD